MIQEHETTPFPTPPWFPPKPSSILNQAGPAWDPVRPGTRLLAQPGEPIGANTHFSLCFVCLFSICLEGLGCSWDPPGPSWMFAVLANVDLNLKLKICKIAV